MTPLVSRHPALAELLDAQLAAAPEHAPFFEKRFAALDEDDVARLEGLAIHVRKLVGGDIEEHARDYAWLCNEQLAEELYFRRHKRYRLSTFEEALREVYSNKAYMTRYMNGLLMTQIWWGNHFQVLEFYRSSFLASNPSGYSHLEIGPGHGLFLYFAAADPRAGKVTAWDISPASIEMTGRALRRFSLEEQPALELQDLFDGPEGSFDSIVFSEVLEHMENPAETLVVLRSLLAEGGRLFINMPINSPAPDHLFNMDSPEELEAFIADAGFKVVDRDFFPATNQTLEAARKKRMTISCVYIAQRG